MAAARILFPVLPAEAEHLVCAICLDVVTKPVTTPCGHNFCKACIQHYWDTRVIYQCPLCNAMFPTRPQMKVNTAMSELAIGHKKWAQVLQNQSAHDILCDICSERKDMAVASCLVCIASFCETHLEPHLRVAGLRGHTLSAPLAGLEDGLCKNHHRLINFYCKTDRSLICGGCIITTHHQNHHIVLLETEYESKHAEVQREITARSQRLGELKLFTTRARVFNEQQIRSRPDLVAAIGAAEQKAEGFITELNTEITELDKKRDDLEHCFDEHHRLVNVDRLGLLLSSLPALLNKDLKNTVLDLNFKLPDTNCARRCATLDPDTAHRDLIDFLWPDI